MADIFALPYVVGVSAGSRDFSLAVPASAGLSEEEPKLLSVGAAPTVDAVVKMLPSEGVGAGVSGAATSFEAGSGTASGAGAGVLEKGAGLLGVNAGFDGVCVWETSCATGVACAAAGVTGAVSCTGAFVSSAGVEVYFGVFFAKDIPPFGFASPLSAPPFPKPPNPANPVLAGFCFKLMEVSPSFCFFVLVTRTRTKMPAAITTIATAAIGTKNIKSKNLK